MNATQGLIKAYKIEDAAGVGQYVAVVQGAADGGVKKPTIENAPGFVGVTVEAQANQTKGVAVQKSGIVRATAKGAITRGDRLRIASASGDVESAEALIIAGPGVPAVIEVIGRAETSAIDKQIFPMWITPETVAIATS